MELPASRDYRTLLQAFDQSLPHFPDGRIDYKKSKKMLVVNVFVVYHQKLLLLKRSDKVLAYQGKRNSIGGFLDELIPLEDKVYQEMQEETGISQDYIDSIRIGQLLSYEDPEIQKVWMAFPVLVYLNTRPEIRLDREHDQYHRADVKELDQFDLIPHFKDIYKHALA